MDYKEKIFRESIEAKKIIESGNYTVIPAAMSQDEFQYVIRVQQIVQTIMYYQKHYIDTETGLRGHPSIWDYLCTILNESDNGNYNGDYYDEIVAHREKIGFPVDDSGFPKMSTRTFERFISGEKVKNSSEILMDFYQNKNFLKIYRESQEEFLSPNLFSYPKLFNKLEQTIEQVDRNAFQEKSGRKFSSKRHFATWRRANLEEYESILRNEE